MNDPFNALMEQLQQHIYEETLREFGKKVFDRWQNPLYAGEMSGADGQARVQGTCGDSMEIFLKFENDRVLKASFRTDGCGPTLVCGSYAAETALGKTSDDLFEITGESILAEVGGLPEQHEHCAFLAAESLHAAADDYMVRQARKEKRNVQAEDEISPLT